MDGLTCGNNKTLSVLSAVLKYKDLALNDVMGNLKMGW